MEAEEKLVGVITHYYPKIKVGVIELADNLSVGDKIRIKGNSTDFEQIVSSIQVEHRDIQQAKKSEVVGIGLDQPASENYKVYKAQ